MRNLNGHRSVSVALDLFHLSTSPEDLAGLRCLHCQSALAFHQPDESSPERLLAICKECKSWFLIELVAGEAEAVMVLLHAGGYFRTALDSRST